SAAEAFKKAGCRLNTLTNYNALLNKALEMKTISNSELEVLERWNKAPLDWIPESKL
ncbi:MAG: hypothetical protein RLZZ46_615, partial [Bacteroidota bacterium]